MIKNLKARDQFILLWVSIFIAMIVLGGYGIGQISQAVNQIDSITQKNAALAEESSSASEQLVEQAGTLEAAVQILNRIITGQGR